MIIKGKVWKFGDDISTDHIAPGRYFYLRTNLPELAKHVLEDADPTFASKVGPGDIIVAGKNFGLGSSREHAPRIIKIAGISCIIAKSFARIFYRNSFNIGLPLLTTDTDRIDEGDKLEINLEKGIVEDVTKDITLKTEAIPPFMLRLIQDGGIEEHIKKYGDFKVEE
ncbi:MAG TPA: 3-isopropylmalate dehydratase small subunit [candidate division WOR-3 bacterium]|uniref:3-isopropylmalate dehydratase small subunit n=1 Tax=candidate division WOR-3 bacterium TaxID=2052148 RepID=A0A7C5DAH2_UNCW3|nr:3-isopropylmalate dehydratase small subunit [candidate division WOR-3 bacterium]